MAAAGQYEKLELVIDWDSQPSQSRVSGLHRRVPIVPPTPALPCAASLVRNCKRRAEPDLDEGWDDVGEVG